MLQDNIIFLLQIFVNVVEVKDAPLVILFGNMFNGNNYPWGADNANAPWNQSDPEEEVRDIEFSCILKKVAEVSTTDYIGGGISKEWDDDHYVSVTEEPDFSNTDWVSEWKNSEYTPINLIEKLKEISETLAKGEMPQRPEGSRKSYWAVLAKACEGWEQEDEYCEMT